MSYNISSEQFSNPVLKELLNTLTDFFKSAGTEFYVIGAAARDIIMSGIHAQQAGRGTLDLDIAIAIPDWDKYDQISEKLCNEPAFSKVRNQQQRFLYKEVYMLDIVPFGEIAKADKYIYWPPDESIAMPVHGFIEAAKEALEVTIDNELKIRVLSLPGIIILKLIAWSDRHLTHHRDAEDIAYIIDNYLSINDERAARHHYDIYEPTPFSKFVAGVTLMARDIKSLIGEEQFVSEKLLNILMSETDKTLESPLINQILETHPSLNYEEVFDALLAMINELNQ